MYCNCIVIFLSLAFKNGWQIISPKKSFAVFAATPTEKAEWMAHINKCIADLLAKSKRCTGNYQMTLVVTNVPHMLVCVGNKKPATEHAAVWVPDSEAQTCMHCLRTKFTPINRRVSVCVCVCVCVSMCFDVLIIISASLSQVWRCSLWCMFQQEVLVAIPVCQTTQSMHLML